MIPQKSVFLIYFSAKFPNINLINLLIIVSKKKLICLSSSFFFYFLFWFIYSIACGKHAQRFAF